MIPVCELKGKTFDTVIRQEIEGFDSIIFKSKDHYYAMIPLGECTANYKNVCIDNILWTLSYLENSEIIRAEINFYRLPEDMEYRTKKQSGPYVKEFPWTSYDIATEKGRVVIIFYSPGREFPKGYLYDLTNCPNYVDILINNPTLWKNMRF